MEPSIKFNGLSWYDTSNDKLCFWNANESQWVCEDQITWVIDESARITYGGDRGIWVGGYNGSSYHNVMDYVTISTPGNAIDFGDLPTNRFATSATSNGTNDRSIIGGGDQSGTTSNIEYITISTPGDATNFGDMTSNRQEHTATSNGTNDRGVMGGGKVNTASSAINVIEYATISVLGNAQDFGDLIQSVSNHAAVSNGVDERGVFIGGFTGTSTRVNTMNYITISTPGDATDFGDLSTVTTFIDGASNDTLDRGVFGGGTSPSNTNVIEYITISTTSDAIDFGDLTVARRTPGSTSNGDNDRAVWGGGATNTNLIDYVTISTTGNAIDFGDLTVARYYFRATSNGPI